MTGPAPSIRFGLDSAASTRRSTELGQIDVTCRTILPTGDCRPAFHYPDAPRTLALTEILGKTLLLAGALLLIVGGLLLLFKDFPFLGKLPGDIRIERENFRFYFPLATCLVLSLILTLILKFFRR